MIKEKAHLLHDKALFDELIERFKKRQLNQSIKKFTSTITSGLKSHELSDEVIAAFQKTIIASLHEGREARNEIAHDIAISLSENPQDEKVVERIRELVPKIAKADFFIAGYIENNINNTPVTPSMDTFVEQAVSWVCDI